MNLEWFSRLKEYDSVFRSRSEHLKSITEQEGRITSLGKKRSEKMAQVSRINSEIISVKDELQSVEEKIKTQTQQRDRWIDQGADEVKVKGFDTEISSLEDRGLELLEKMGTLEEERKDAQTFIEGISRTIDEITSEAQQEVRSHQEALRVIEERLSSLLEMLPSDFRDVLQRVQKKNLAHGPFTRIESGSCFFCRYKISRMDESEIDMQKKLRTCPQCGRIFIPYGT